MNIRRLERSRHLSACYGRTAKEVVFIFLSEQSFSSSYGRIKRTIKGSVRKNEDILIIDVFSIASFLRTDPLSSSKWRTTWTVIFILRKNSQTVVLGKVPFKKKIICLEFSRPHAEPPLPPFMSGTAIFFLKSLNFFSKREAVSSSKWRTVKTVIFI